MYIRDSGLKVRVFYSTAYKLIARRFCHKFKLKTQYRNTYNVLCAYIVIHELRAAHKYGKLVTDSRDKKIKKCSAIWHGRLNKIYNI